MTQSETHEIKENQTIAEQATINNASKSLISTKSAFFFVPIGFVLIGGVLIFKEAISESLVQSFLKSKGIESEIDVAKISASGANLRRISLSKDGSKTLLAENAVLKWHLGNKFTTHIDELSAQSLNLSLAYNEKGFDLGALQEFLKPGGKKSNLAIHEIKVQNLSINLKTPKGEIIGRGKIYGALESGLKGTLKINLPEKIAPPSHDILYGFALAPVKEGGSTIIGNSLSLQNLSLATDIVKGLGLNRLSGNLVFGLIAPKTKDQGFRIQIQNSKIDSERFRFAEFSANNLNLEFQNSWVNLGQNFVKDAVFDIKGTAKSSQLNFATNALNNFGGEYSIARAKAGNIRLEIAAKSGAINSAIKANGSELNGIINFMAPDLSKFESASFEGLFDTEILNIRGGATNTFKNYLLGTGFENYLNNPNLKAKIALNSDGQTLIIRPIDGLYLNNSNARLSFNANQASGIFVPIGSKGENHIVLSGIIDGKSANSNNISALVKAFELKNEKIFTDFANLRVTNIKGAGFNLNIQNADGSLSLQKGNITNAKLRARLNSNDKKLKLDAVFEGNILNNFLKFTSTGFSKTFSFMDVKSSNFGFEVKGSGNLNSVINADGDINIGEISGKSFSIKGANGDIAANLNPKKMAAQVKSLINVKSFASEKLSLEGGTINGNGLLSHKNGIIFRGDIDTDIARMGIEDNLIRSAKLKGPISISQTGNTIGFNSVSCLSLDFKEYLTNGLSLTSSMAKVCPDNKSRLLGISNTNTKLYATTQIGAAKLLMGKGEDAMRVILDDFRGHFTPSTGSIISFSGNSNALELQFKTAPEKWASIISKNADFDLVNTNQGTKIRANLGDLSSKGLAVELFGAASGQFNALESGFSGAFDINNLLVSDGEKVKRFEDIIVNGQGELNNNKVTIFGDAALKRNSINVAQIFLNHDLNTQKGGVLVDAPKLEFGKPLIGYDNQILQAKDIVPAISSLFGRSSGEIAATARFEWAPNQKLISIANVKTNNLSFESTQGSINSINGEIIIDDLLNLKTSQSQNLKIGSFDVGIPIENGIVGFSLNGTDNVTIDKAEWPFADGVLSLVPVKIEYANPDLKLAVKVQSIDMAKFLRLTKIPNLEIEGKMSGILPVYMVDNGFEIRGGILKADSGGSLRYTGPSPVPETPKAQGLEKIKNKVFGEPPPPVAEMAFKALSDLRYKVLEIRIDGRTTGDATISVLLEGYNPALMSGQGFRFNIKIALPLNSLVGAYNNFKKSPSQFLQDYGNPYQ